MKIKAEDVQKLAQEETGERPGDGYCSRYGYLSAVVAMLLNDDHAKHHREYYRRKIETAKMKAAMAAKEGA